jgi:hypothetical protein
MNATKKQRMLVVGRWMLSMLLAGLLKLELFSGPTDMTNKQRMLVAGGWMLSVLLVSLLKLELFSVPTDVTKKQRMLVAGGWMLSMLLVGLLRKLELFSMEAWSESINFQVSSAVLDNKCCMLKKCRLFLFTCYTIALI